MNNDIAENITNRKFTQYINIQHKTVNFVDDSTSVISGHNLKHLQDYTTDYYTLIHSYYTINKLLIKPDKTKFIITCKPCLQNKVGNLEIQAK